MLRLSRSWVSAAVVSASALIAICAAHSLGVPSAAPVPPASLDVLEINGESMPLMTTRLVGCNRTSPDEVVFFWTGSNILLPRRPLDDQDSDRVEVRFHGDPLTVSEFELTINRRGVQKILTWADTADVRSRGSATLTPRGPHRYSLSGVAAESTRASEVFIDFHC